MPLVPSLRSYARRMLARVVTQGAFRAHKNSNVTETQQGTPYDD
jgi:hypothetical protein